jgi:uncharacterized membrane protein
MNIYTIYVILAILMILIDSIWIYINSKMYLDVVKNIQNKIPKINIIGVFIAYIFVLFSLYFVAIPLADGLKKNNLLYTAIMSGGCVGLSIYGIYNLTCFSLFENYPANVAIIDTLWGGFLYTLIIYIYLIIKKI